MLFLSIELEKKEALIWKAIGKNPCSDFWNKKAKELRYKRECIYEKI